MWTADKWKDYEVLDTSEGEKLERWGSYEVLDTSEGEKLERWGSYLLIRPDPQVIWQTEKTRPEWKKPNGHYHRSSKGGGSWEFFDLPKTWQISYGDLVFNLKPFSFKHTGLFPEQAANWDWFTELIRNAGRPIKVLNLFAYTGGATCAVLAAGASVTHVDASKGMVTWARENAESSGLADRPVRWLVDDCTKFVEREIRRGHRYDAIIMDPPSYGRGPAHPAVRAAPERPSALLPDQLLYDGPAGRRAHLHDEECAEGTPSGPCRVLGDRPAGLRE